jgi:hypothetical protein
VELIPFGNPLRVTLTDPVNPFNAFSVTATGAVVPPTWAETEAGETAILKSGVGGTGVDEDPPHPLKRHEQQMEIKNN